MMSFHSKQIINGRHTWLFLILLSCALNTMSCSKKSASQVHTSKTQPEEIFPTQRNLQGGESKAIALAHLRYLDFHSQGCKPSSARSADYSDCYFTRDDEKVLAAFYRDRLQMLSYQFDYWRFSQLLTEVKSIYGEPSGVPAGSECLQQCPVAYEWCVGKPECDVNISILPIENNSRGNANFFIAGQDLLQHHLVQPFPYPAVETASERNDAAQKFAERKRREAECPATEDNCITVTALKSEYATITQRDANGYQNQEGPPLQRLTVSLRGKTDKDGLYINGQNFKFADILCLSNCTELVTGEAYRMTFGQAQTHERPCYAVYGSCWDYDRLPYVAMNDSKGSTAAWQILEVCTADNRCIPLSTVNAR